MASRSKYSLVETAESNADLEMNSLDESSCVESFSDNVDNSKAPYSGLLLAVISSLMFSLCSLIVKLLNAIPETELAVFRFIGVLLPSLSMIIYRGDSPFPKGYLTPLFLRAIFGTTSLLLQFYAFRNMPLADASVIVFSVPAFVAVFARIFLKEPCGKFQSILIVVTLSGVVIISRPPWLFGALSQGYTSDNWKGAIAASCGTIVGAVVYITLRALKSLHFSVVMTDFGLMGVLISILVTVTADVPVVPTCGASRWLILALSILSFGGQMCLTKALQIEEAGPVSVARTADIVFAFIWQFIFFQEIPDILSVMGAILVTSCVALLGVRKWLLALPDHRPIKRTMAFLVK